MLFIHSNKLSSHIKSFKQSDIGVRVGHTTLID